MAQSTFVTTIIGLSTGIFGLYVATGRKWDKIGYYDQFPHPSYPPPDDDSGWWDRRRPPYWPRPPFYGPRGPYGGEQDNGTHGPPPLPETDFKPSDNGPKWENPFGEDDEPRNPGHDVR